MAIAKAACTCRICGNQFTVRAERFNRAAADSFEAWAVENITVCNECKREKIDAERIARNAAAAQKNKEAGLPQLKGSAKQVAWAESIREQGITLIAEVEAPDDPDASAFLSMLKDQQSAAFWIDHRDVFDPKRRPDAVVVVNDLYTEYLQNGKSF